MMTFVARRRLARLRRMVEDPDFPGHCAQSVLIRYAEPYGTPIWAVEVQFSDRLRCLGLSKSLRHALLDARRVAKRMRPSWVNSRYTQPI